VLYYYYDVDMDPRLQVWLRLLFLAPLCFGWSFLPFRKKQTTKIVVTFPRDTANATIHQHFMRLAVAQAQHGAAICDEVPIGALVVRPLINDDNNNDNNTRSFQILAAQHNRVETCCDAAAHAELLALREAAQTAGNWRLLNTTLYATLEPCAICLSSAQAFRVHEIVYGAADHRLGAVATHLQLLDVAQHPFHNITAVTAGVLEQECGDLLRDFFRRKRQLAKQEKKKQDDYDSTATMDSNTSQKSSSSRFAWLWSWRRRRRNRRRD